MSKSVNSYQKKHDIPTTKNDARQNTSTPFFNSSPHRYSWKHIFNIAKTYKRELIIANIIALLSTLASVPTPLIMSLMVDQVLLNTPGALLDWIKMLTPESMQEPTYFILMSLLITVILRLLSSFFNICQNKLFTVISTNIIYQIRCSLLQKMKHIAMSQYESIGTGSVVSRFISDMNVIDQFIASSIGRFLIAALSILGTALVLLWIHWQLALVILFFNPIVIWFTTSFGKKIKSLKNKENRAIDIFQTTLTEVLNGIYQIRTANRERHYLSLLMNQVKSIRDKSGDFAWKNESFTRFSFVIFMIGIDVFRAFAMITVLLSDLTLGQMFAVFGYLWFMMGPVNELLTMQYSFYSASAALHRINDVLSLEEEKQFVTKHNPFKDKKTVAIEFQDIHFSYSDASCNKIPVLNGVSLTIHKGEKIALVGASGGGKSTLVKVLLGLYLPDKGDILFDGVSINQISRTCLREHVATIIQHPVLFNTTVKDNLTLGRNATDEELWNALEVAQLKPFIQQTPQQLNTNLGNNGVRLSGGQRQRLAIARMVVANPSVVIMDEATSALDTETEKQLHLALESFLSKRTTLIIAHRLSAIKKADKVFVFENGKIAETGSHEELLNQKGLYHKLYADIVHHKPS